MNGLSLQKFIGDLKAGGTLFINSSIVKDKIERDDIRWCRSVTEMAFEMGNARTLNIIMLESISDTRRRSTKRSS